MGTQKDPLTVQCMETWYQQTVSKLYRFTYALLQNREEAEDITQETYFRCLRKDTEELPSYSYLKQVARNLVNDRYRHWQMTQSKNVNQPKSHISATEEDWVNQALVQEIMSQLLEEHREVLELRIIRGYTRKETAERMGRSEDSIRGLQYRALKAFRDLLQAREENGG